jgi:catechol 2,3-dioxygenase-like lactoylglutathione lyase family enzyme
VLGDSAHVSLSFVINGAHVIVYSSDPAADLAFFRDVLGFPYVDAGGGRLFFKLPPNELAVHEADTGGAHELYLTCDDITETIAQLTNKGVKCTPPADRGWGIMTTVTLPGGGELGIYEPRHPRATDL